MAVQTSRPESVRNMFARVAPRYDLANSVLSLGVHHRWRRRVVRECGVHPGDRVLDCATGTGDLAIEFQRMYGNTLRVTAADFCPEMMVTGPAKAREAGVDVLFEQADLMDLTYRDASFDVATVAFGIRNVEDPAAAIAGLGRVIRPGGRLVILEFGRPKNTLWGGVYGGFSRHVLPRVGGALTGDREAYAYLDHSTSGFPCGERMAGLIRSAYPFREVKWTPLTGGIAYLYRADK